MTDTPVESARLRATWIGLAHRLAVAGACAVGLLSLFHHAPATTACLRGGALYVAIRVIAKLGLFAVERAIALEPETTTTPGDTK